MKSIKKTLQSDEWQDFLAQEAEDGNEDALVILDYMEKRGWVVNNPHPAPLLMTEKPTEEWDCRPVHRHSQNKEVKYGL